MSRANDILFQPFTINKTVLKNRMLMIPMHTLFAVDNKVTERDVEYIRRRAQGGPSAITISAAVAKRGSLFHQHHICSDDCIDGFRKLADVCHESGCKFFVQLFHCGRCGNEETLEGLKPMAPSAIPSRIYKAIPDVMTIEDIHTARQQFVDAARRAKAAGIDGVEVSVSVGYLLP